MSKSIPWLLLIPQLPAKPAYLRVKVWRRLQAIGAAPLKNAVHALPATSEARVLFDDLYREIVENGGEAMILEARLAAGMADADLRGLFDAARDADYEELARDARALAEADYVPAAEARRLRRRLTDIAALDFFGAHGRQTAEAALDLVEVRAGRHPDVSGEGVSLLTGDALKNRVWVTRRYVHVDRIASAWLIRRFIDPSPTFRFVDAKSHEPKPDDLRFDMAGAEFTHEGDRCTFETLMYHCGLNRDPGILALAEIVHDLDIADDKFGRIETAGVSALIGGICVATDNDDERLAQGASALDGLHAHFVRHRAQAEKA